MEKFVGIDPYLIDGISGEPLCVIAADCILYLVQLCLKVGWGGVLNRGAAQTKLDHLQYPATVQNLVMSLC